MFFSEVADAYRRTRKPKDILWNRFVARPLAAVFVVPLARTPVTPNQITFLTLVIFVAGAALLALGPGWQALILGVAILELSYIFDCVDGQLARLKQMSSPVGAHLDFLMDELKAFVLVAAVGARLWLATADARYLLEALLGLVAVASAISLTTFVRRPEYAAATGGVAARGAGDYGEGFATDDARPKPAGFSPLRALEGIGRFLVHYPSYILFVALANRIDLFLHVYVAINAAYAGRTLLGAAVKLGEAGVKAIIVAAGRGRRLGPETVEIPKCMVAVGGRSILHRQLDALSAAGVNDVVIVRGYLGDKIEAPGRRLRFIENPDWANNNILASLMYAESEMPGGFLFSYSDIVFAPEHVRRLVIAADDVGLVVDRRWDEAYLGRTQHPVSEAELAKVEGGDGGGGMRGARVTRVGKRVVPVDQAAGEFIGLARFSDAGARALRQVWQAALAGGLESPFGTAATLRNAYLSDALNAMADAGTALSPVIIDGRWREIDTEEDLGRANAVINTWG